MSGSTPSRVAIAVMSTATMFFFGRVFAWNANSL